MRHIRLPLAILLCMMFVFLFAGYYRQFDAEFSQLLALEMGFLGVAGLLYALWKDANNPNPPTPPSDLDGRP